jgi:hypothetical protein
VGPMTVPGRTNRRPLGECCKAGVHENYNGEARSNQLNDWRNRCRLAVARSTAMYLPIGLAKSLAPYRDCLEA